MISNKKIRSKILYLNSILDYSRMIIIINPEIIQRSFTLKFRLRKLLLNLGIISINTTTVNRRIYNDN